MNASFITLRGKVEGGKPSLDNKDLFLNFCVNNVGEGKEFEMVVSIAKKEDQRTANQNRALHLFFEMLADTLNNAGLDTHTTLDKIKVDIPWTKELVKDALWKPIQKHALGTTSTTELKKHEDIEKIWDILNRFFGEKLKVELPAFPSYENQEIKPNQ